MPALRLVPAFLVAGLLACEANSPVDAVPSDIGGPSLMGGHGAVVVPNCLERGSEFTSIVPVSETDWYFTDVEVKSSNCRTQPSGAHQENFVFQVLSDIIPLPAKNVRVSFADEFGTPISFRLFLEDGTFLGNFNIVCVFDAAPFDQTFNASAWTTPSGVTGAKCTFDS